MRVAVAWSRRSGAGRMHQIVHIIQLLLDSPDVHVTTAGTTCCISVHTAGGSIPAACVEAYPRHVCADFGVICPYRKQVLFVRKALRQHHLGAVRVGTVDDYQGQQAKVVIISTVCVCVCLCVCVSVFVSVCDPSSGLAPHLPQWCVVRQVLSHNYGYFGDTPVVDETLDTVAGAGAGAGAGAVVGDETSKSSSAPASNGRHHSSASTAPGLLGNPKLFNVALTRAQALNIVVGNPSVLVADAYWGRLLDYCADNDAYRGVRLPSMLPVHCSPLTPHTLCSQCPCPELGFHTAAQEPGLDPDTGLVSRLAAMALRGALLGPGDVAKHMPSDLDMYYADEQQWRVML